MNQEEAERDKTLSRFAFLAYYRRQTSYYTLLLQIFYLFLRLF